MNLIKTFKRFEKIVDQKREYNTDTYVTGWEFDMHDDKPCLICHYDVCYSEDVPSDQEFAWDLLERFPTQEELQELKDNGYNYSIGQRMLDKIGR